MSQIRTEKSKLARPARSAFAGASSGATARSTAGFDAARRSRIAATPVPTGAVTSPKESTPGLLLIGIAVAETIFVEPIRALKRKFRQVTRAA